MATIFSNDKDNKNDSLKNRILECFILDGNSTNTDLAKELGLSVPTVSKLINEMTEEGFVNEYGKLETAEGRKPNLYGLNPDSGYFIGVDIKQQGLNIGLMNFRGDLVELLNNAPYEPQNTEASLDELCRHIREFVANLSIDTRKILDIGINISGRVNPDTGYSYSMFNFSELPLTKLMEEKLGYPVSIDNDTRAMAFGEYMQGCVRGEKNVLFVNLSWGLGVGIIIDGQLYKGKSGFAGEFGHIHAFDNGILCHCGKKGCLETEASGSAFCRVVKERIAAGETSVLSAKPLDEITFDDVIEATEREDPLCLDALEGIGLYLGEHVASLINLFNPELVIIGGTMSLTGDFLMHSIRTSILKYSLNLVNKDTHLCISKLKERAGVVGACMLARKYVLEM
ncbi:ROK family transcriptional regulator [Prevotella sp. kh1p2]|jgi:glucokinase-like ROK family protein|uniref:ROK family transcriptional regulator n=1 Tax=Prevotella sp. kh1p2 TaxID=1761883 RepID=UPI0008BBFC2C|nr:ROK family transcriptional regulator [Prevotella sp. kh1p2]SET20475.1 ROK family protein (putative glucokinase) [Prevotella sp. kh1p2]SNU12266.1 ROK family protein (putative glucokinase) [Prevotellaceae bacterium KH2P17]